MSRAKTKKVKAFVSKRIREARKKAKVSQIDLGKKLSLSDKTVSAWETGRAEPSLDSLFIIAQTTNQPIDFFLKDEDYSVESKLNEIEKEIKKLRKLLSSK